MDDAPDVEKAYQNCFNHGLCHLWLLWLGAILSSPMMTGSGKLSS
jgi:hypothetical protein